MSGISCHLSLPLCKETQTLNSYNWWTLRYHCWSIHTGYKQKGPHMELKMTQIDFSVLNSHVTVIYKIYQKHLILRGKTEKSKIAVFFPTIYPFM